MLSRPTRLLLGDIREAIDKIARYTRDMNEETFLKDDKSVDAVVRNLEIIGEAAGRLPDDFKQAYPEPPWRKIIGFRNRIVHEYFGVDLEIVWNIIENEMPLLKAALERIDLE